MEGRAPTKALTTTWKLANRFDLIRKPVFFDGTYLHALHLSHGSEGPEGSQRSHGLEDGNVSGPEETGTEIDEGDGNNDKIQPTPGIAEIHNTAHGKEFEVGLEEKDHGEDTIKVI